MLGGAARLLPAPSRSLSLSGLPFTAQPDALAAQLAAASCAARPLLLRVAVSSFTEQGVAEFCCAGGAPQRLPPAFEGGDVDVRRRPRDADKANRGSAQLCFASAGAARFAAVSLAAAFPGYGVQLAAPHGGTRAYLREELAARRARLEAATEAARLRAEEAAPHRERRRERGKTRAAAELADALRCALALPPAQPAENADTEAEASELEAAAGVVYSSWVAPLSASAVGAVDWAAAPDAVDPVRGGGLGDTPRGLRKRAQVVTFAALLRTLVGVRPPGAPPLAVVDFGAGTGNLTLPLAWALRRSAVRFTAVDGKAASCAALAERAAAGGLAAVVAAVVGRIEAFESPFDVALGLHVCGAGSDAAVAAAVAAHAVFIISPCCIGKLAGGGGALIPQPRSARLAGRLKGEQYSLLARSADFSGGGGVDGYDTSSARGRLPRAAKAVVEADRCAAASDAGYEVRLAPLLLDAEVGIKKDCIVGWHRERTPARARAALQALFTQPAEW